MWLVIIIPSLVGLQKTFPVQNSNKAHLHVLLVFHIDFTVYVIHKYFVIMNNLYNTETCGKKCGCSPSLTSLPCSPDIRNNSLTCHSLLVCPVLVHCIDSNSTGTSKLSLQRLREGGISLVTLGRISRELCPGGQTPCTSQPTLCTGWTKGEKVRCLRSWVGALAPGPEVPTAGENSQRARGGTGPQDTAQSKVWKNVYGNKRHRNKQPARDGDQKEVPRARGTRRKELVSKSKQTFPFVLTDRCRRDPVIILGQ